MAFNNLNEVKIYFQNKLSSISAKIVEKGGNAVTKYDNVEAGINSIPTQKPEQSKSMVLGSSTPNTVTPDSGYALSSVTPSIDTAVIKAENIAEGVQLLGILGTHSGGGGTKYGATIGGMLGDVDDQGALQDPTEEMSLNFVGVKRIPSNILQYKFRNHREIVSALFPDLTALDSAALQYAFAITSVFTGRLALVSMPNLNSIQSNSLAYAFIGQDLSDTDFNIPHVLLAPSSSFSSTFKQSGIKSFHADGITGVGGSSAFANAFQESTNADFEFSMRNLTSVSATMGFYYTFASAQATNPVVFPNLSSITGIQAFANAFSSCTYMARGQVWHPFPALCTINGYSTFTSAFIYTQCSRIVFDALLTIGATVATTYTTFSFAWQYSNMSSSEAEYDKCGEFFPSLTTIGMANTSSRDIFSSCFTNSNNRHTMHFYNLTTVHNSSSNTAHGQFYACNAKRIYMPKVTNLGVYNQYCFNNSTLTEEIHFGIENEATITAMNGYATKFGASGATIYFDMANHITVDGVVYDRDGAKCDLDNWYFAWTNGNTTVYTTDFKCPSVGSTVYTRSGDTYTASGTVSLIS